MAAAASVAEGTAFAAGAGLPSDNSATAAVNLGNALRQAVNVLLGRYAERTQRTGDALLEHGLQTIPRTGRLASHFGDFLVGDLAGTRLNAFTFLDQCIEDLVAFVLALAKAPSQPARSGVRIL